MKSDTERENLTPHFDAHRPALHLDTIPDEGERVELPEEEERHLRALRLRSGDELILLDGRGGRAIARLEEGERRSQPLRVLRRMLEPAEGGPYIELGVGLLADRTRFEWIIEKGVELGASRIIPLRTRRAEGRLQPERARRIAVAALKQSQRSWLPELSDAVPPATLLEESGRFSHVYLCHEAADPGRTLARSLIGASRPGPTLLLVGPEGGFTDEEVAGAADAGAEVVSLGPDRLRAETAAVVALALARSILPCIAPAS